MPANLTEPAEHEATPRRRPGRPKRADAPIIPWDVVDRLLVFGEVAQDPRTGQEAVKFPSLAELAERYGVSCNRMWQYASKARCFVRREEARLKTQETYERKVIEEVASSRAHRTTTPAASTIPVERSEAMARPTEPGDECAIIAVHRRRAACTGSGRNQRCAPQLTAVLNKCIPLLKTGEERYVLGHDKVSLALNSLS
jgi:hypothetical protein